MGSVVTSLSKQFSYLQELSGLQGSSHRAEKVEYFLENRPMRIVNKRAVP